MATVRILLQAMFAAALIIAATAALLYGAYCVIDFWVTVKYQD